MLMSMFRLLLTTYSTTSLPSDDCRSQNVGSCVARSLYVAGWESGRGKFYCTTYRCTTKSHVGCMLISSRIHRRHKLIGKTVNIYTQHGLSWLRRRQCLGWLLNVRQLQLRLPFDDVLGNYEWCFVMQWQWQWKWRWGSKGFIRQVAMDCQGPGEA